MNIAIIGSGGREHAICDKILQSKQVNQVYCIPGNAGTSKIAKNLDVDFNNFQLLYKTIKKYNITFVVVGPEKPLVNGVVDYLKKRKINVFGPNKYASNLEGSKSFVKNICKKRNIPTAKFKVCKNETEFNNFIKKNKFPLVVKADGLASGKGVFICKTKKESIAAAKKVFSGIFKSSNKVVVEEFLSGQEVSYFLIVDRKTYRFFGSAQDHKKVGEGDVGLNTGGMGAYSPSPLINKIIEKKILKQIINPTLIELKKRKNPFTGFLYAGLMIVKNNPYLIEYNVRMGDPECQVILPRLKSDFFNIINSCINNNLSKTTLRWSKDKCMTIVLCSKGYPGKFKKDIYIGNLNKIKRSAKTKIYHAGTLIKKNKIFSSGGRILNVVILGKKFLNIRKKILSVLKKINWKFGFYRKDIGWRVIEK